MLIRRLKKKTGIEKLKPSIFRPTNITHDVESGKDLTYVMKKNWGHFTKTINIYAKPGREYMDRVALSAAGIKQAPRTGQTSGSLKPLICPRCHTLNPTGAEHCIHCGYGLTDRALVEEAEFTEFMNDPDRLIRFGQFLKKKRAGKP
jgi:hypothetical protein